jgi:hypothetical protein
MPLIDGVVAARNRTAPGTPCGQPGVSLWTQRVGRPRRLWTGQRDGPGLCQRVPP